jgi:hypothetical protein
MGALMSGNGVPPFCFELKVIDPSGVTEMLGMRKPEQKG